MRWEIGLLVKRSLIDEREERESDIMRYFSVVLKLLISVRQSCISVSSEMRMEAES